MSPEPGWRAGRWPARRGARHRAGRKPGWRRPGMTSDAAVRRNKRIAPCPLTEVQETETAAQHATTFWSENDPDVWSGRASQEVSSICWLCGLASMYPASDWSGLCSGPSWISARVRSHYRTGLKRAIWVTRVRMRREDRSSISFHPLADLGRKRDYVIALSLIGAVPLFVP